jgi:hypothetical protein
MTRRQSDAKEGRVYAWAVEAPDGFVSLFKEHGRAVEYAARCHGVVIPLFDLRDEVRAARRRANKPVKG